MKRAEREAWRNVSSAEKIRAVTEITTALYAMKGSMPDFAEPGNFAWAHPVMVDILSSISGVDFDQAWQRRVEFAVDSDLNASFISREDLVVEGRLCGFVKVTVDSRQLLARGGCPIGTLCTELHKEDDALAKHSTVLFSELLKWFETQFRALGAKADAHGLAVHLLSALQGIAVLAHTLRDPKIVIGEAERLQGWIQ